MAAFDLVIIGGGINGVGLARDAAGRGLRVLLLEQNDLASGTSSASTKLIHGGLRYLEHGAFRLVREALREREVLLRMAPHLVRPLRFVIPHGPGLRPAWMLRLGLFLYDHLGGRDLLPGSSSVDLRTDPAAAALQPRFSRAYAYFDCQTNDSRLVIANAVHAAERGAVIRSRTCCIAAVREGKDWRVEAESSRGREQFFARALVNAAGPWVAQVSEAVLGRRTHAPIRLVKGSHIVVPRLFDHGSAYLLQNPDGRVVFAIPYEDDFTLIGTTDIDHPGEPGPVAASAEEIAYLCDAVGAYLRVRPRPEDVVWSFAGLRPLYDDGATRAKDATRDYVLALDAPEAGAPLLTIYGGKLTTYRRLAEAALARLAPWLAAGPAWTADAPLPGGGFAVDGIPDLTANARARYPFLDQSEARRLVHAYGTRLDEVLGARDSAAQVGPIGEAELRYLMQREWAVTLEDVLWRRSKLGLRADGEASETLALRMNGLRSAATSVFDSSLPLAIERARS